MSYSKAGPLFGADLILDIVSLHKVSYKTTLQKVQCLASLITGQALYFFPVIRSLRRGLVLGADCPKPQDFLKHKATLTVYLESKAYSNVLKRLKLN